MIASGNQKYIGARYVPIIMGDWNALTKYEPLMVVLYQGTSYTSKTTVPAGVLPTVSEYWAKTGDYNAQVEQYRQEVDQYSEEVAQMEVELSKVVNKMTFVTPELFGGKGDGITDDSTAIQTALNTGLPLVLCKTYLVNSNVNVPSNSTIFGGTIIKGTINNAFTCDNNKNILFSGITFKDNQNGSVIVSRNCENVKIIDCSFYRTGTNTGGGWCIIISGKDIIIDNLIIDCISLQVWGDGIHCGECDNMLITNFNIKSGDDCIALCPQPGAGHTGTEPNGKYGNIIISNGVCETAIGIAIRIGGQDLSNESTFHWEDIRVENVVISNSSQGIGFTDTRTTITNKHRGIVYDNISIINPKVGSTYASIYLLGKNLLKDVSLSNFNIKTTDIHHAILAQIDNLEELFLSNIRVKEEVSQIATIFQIQNVQKVRCQNISIRAQKSKPFVLSNCESFIIKSSEIKNEDLTTYASVLINGTNPKIFMANDCTMDGGVIGIRDEGTGTIDLLSVFGSYFPNSTTKVDTVMVSLATKTNLNYLVS